MLELQVRKTLKAPKRPHPLKRSRFVSARWNNRIGISFLIQGIVVPGRGSHKLNISAITMPRMPRELVFNFKVSDASSFTYRASRKFLGFNRRLVQFSLLLASSVQYAISQPWRCMLENARMANGTDRVTRQGEMQASRTWI